MDSKFLGLISFSVIVEALITYSDNLILAGGGFHIKMLISIALGILVAVAYKLDLLDLIGMKSDIPYIGSVLTGILLSRASNYVYDLFTLLKGIK